MRNEGPLYSLDYILFCFGVWNKDKSGNKEIWYIKKHFFKLIFTAHIRFWANRILREPHPQIPQHHCPDCLASPFTVWLTEIPEIQADGSYPWLMMSQADPFLCPLRSHSNPPQFPYVLHDKSHHAFLLTLLGPLIHFGPSSSEPGF